ncbi:MAG: peptidase [Alphaproteobacteria bacterium]|nr:peptidase [Alphaproteobacteria bacterium]
MGAAEQQNILKQFNGPVDNAELTQFVQRVGAKLTPYAERKDVTWTFTVLNDDLVNAFAVPGGYIYITRGLLNLAQDESQVAAVLAHEMGHINARHSAQQQSQSMLANLGLSILGTATGSNAASQLGGVGADLFIKKYSRTHELESDALSVKYLAAAGYDPYANTKFLAMLERYTQLQEQIAGQGQSSVAASYFATHPPTPERVTRAREIADTMPKNANAIVNRSDYLRAIDGTVYGDSPEQGFVRGNEFIHPGLKIRFTAPQGFKIQNSAEQVAAQNSSGAAMIFASGRGPDEDPANYIISYLGANAQLTAQEKIIINGMPAATASTRLNTSQGAVDARIVAISAGGGNFYRLTFIAPVGQMENYATAFRTATYSFNKISDSEAKGYSPNRVRLIKVKSGDTVQSLAAQMPVKDYPAERFALLNGITPQTALEPGETVKTVAPF